MIVKQTAKWGGQCSCGERWNKFEQFINVQGRRGENYCVGCLDVAVSNNHGQTVADEIAVEAPHIASYVASGLVTVPGDHRKFARTQYGLRAGWEHTGIRCEDAPCCGCCD